MESWPKGCLSEIQPSGFLSHVSLAWFVSMDNINLSFMVLMQPKDAKSAVKYWLKDTNAGKSAKDS